MFFLGTFLGKATPLSAGYDLAICEDVDIPSHDIVLARTGLRIALPRGSVGLIVPRSSSPLKWGVTLANSPGILDADYRGEIKLILLNITNHHTHIPSGTRLAQLVVVPVLKTEPLPFDGSIEQFEQSSDRGSNGFGSSGS